MYETVQHLDDSNFGGMVTAPLAGRYRVTLNGPRITLALLHIAADSNPFPRINIFRRTPRT